MTILSKLGLTAFAVATTLLTGCAGTIHKTSQLGHVAALSIDARQRLIISGKRPDGQNVICAEPSPDAIVARASYVAAGGNILSKGSGQVGGGSAESAGSIGLRTQTIQLLRDGYYRVCEAYLNGAIENSEYLTILQHIDTFMIALVSIESLGGVTAAPAIAIGASGKLTLNGQTNDLAGEAAAEKSTIQTITAATASLSPAQAKAIAEVVLTYLDIRARGR